MKDDTKNLKKEINIIYKNVREWLEGKKNLEKKGIYKKRGEGGNGVDQLWDKNINS